jgi:CheY-like chemotaxis protein
MLQPRVLDLNAVVAETEKMLSRLLGEDISLTTTLASNLAHVKVDPGQLDQILMNLAINARDAMPTGGQLTIETSNVLLNSADTIPPLNCKTGPHVMLAMSDTGCGMSAAVLAQIFEPFFTTKPLDKGTGLGLSMVLGIVQQSGGCVHAYSEPGHGTTLKIYFPVVAEQLTESVHHNSGSAAYGTETILLVEDELGVRALATRMLQKYGYTVLTAIDGRDALTIANAYLDTIDLVLTDVIMPNLSGPEVAKSLGARFPLMKVLFMSGYTGDAVVRHGLIEADVSFIQKPYTALGLAQRVRQVLDQAAPS